MIVPEGPDKVPLWNYRPKNLLCPRPPNVSLLRALWSPSDGIWGVLKGSWGVLDGMVFGA